VQRFGARDGRRHLCTVLARRERSRGSYLFSAGGKTARVFRLLGASVAASLFNDRLKSCRGGKSALCYDACRYSEASHGPVQSSAASVLAPPRRPSPRLLFQAGDAAATSQLLTEEEESSRRLATGAERTVQVHRDTPPTSCEDSCGSCASQATRLDHPRDARGGVACIRLMPANSSLLGVRVRYSGLQAVSAS
jgi:hypothetical protein